MSLLASFLPAIRGKVQEWIEAQRTLHAPAARTLSAEERAQFGDYFGNAVLSSARVKLVERIENPPFLEGLLKQAAFLGIRVNFDFAGVSGITFVDCILIRQQDISTGLLFHELVHVEQYRQLGTPAFVRAYVQGMAEADFVYERIPLEANASQLTARFAAAEKFSVAEELAPWLRARGYLKT